MAGFEVSKKTAAVSLAAICILFFIFKLPFLMHYPMWDEAVYIGMGKYMFSGGQSGLWEMIRPLGLPFVTGLLWVSGLDPLLAGRVVAALFSLGLIVSVYFLGNTLFGRKEGLLAALILAITPVFFYYSDYVLTDHISALLMTLALLSFAKERYAAAGALAGIAFWFKFTHVLLIAGALLYFLYVFISSRREFVRSARKYALFVAAAGFFVLVYFISNYIIYSPHFGNPVDAVLRPYIDASRYQDNPYQNILFNDFKSFLEYLLYYPLNIIFNPSFGLLLYIASFLGVFFFFFSPEPPKRKNGASRKMHLAVLLIFAAYLLHASIIPYKNPRFWVLFLPVMAVYSAYGLMKLADSINSRKASWKIPALLGLLAFFVACSAAAMQDMSDFRDWYVAEDVGRPVMDIERYFDTKGIEGPTLTTDPRFVVYSDARYVPAYDILNPKGLFVNDWEREIPFEAVAYSERAPCLADDSRCSKFREELLETISKDYSEMDSYFYNGANVTFFVRR